MKKTIMSGFWSCFLPGLCLALAGSFTAVEELHAFQVKGLKTPESFIADPGGGGYFISNINGKPTDKNNNGFITKLDETGKIVSLKFIEGGVENITLHAPKGLDIIGDTLYVTDIDFVRGFDKKTGKLLYDLDLTRFGASFLNDLTHDPEGNLYVTDMKSHMILKILTQGDHQAFILAQDPSLKGPNGIVFQPSTGKLVVVTWNSGSILEVDPTGRIKVLLDSPGLKNLDGVDIDETGNFYVSSFTDGRIYTITPDFKKVRLLKEGLTTPADINLDRAHHRLLIPLFNQDQAWTQKIR